MKSERLLHQLQIPVGRNRLLILVILSGILFNACEVRNEDDIELKITAEQVRQKSVELGNPQIVELDIDTTSVCEQAFYLLSDSMVIVQNDGRSSSFVDLYSLETGKRVAKLAPQGRGPGEFSQATVIVPSNDANTLYVADGVKMHFVDVEQTLENNGLQIVHSFPYWQADLHSYMNVCPIDKESYVGYNLWYTDDSEYNTLNVPMLVKYNVGGSAQTSEMGEYFPGNVNGATMFVNPVNNQIWVADWHKDVIQICDTSLNVVKRITGPYDYNAGRYITMNSNAPFKMLMFPDEGIYKSYGNYTYTKDNVYIIYEDVRGVNYKSYENEALAPVSVFKFSWDGELEQVYKLDRHVSTISINSSGNKLYCTQQDYLAGEIEFVVYDLQPVLE